MKTIKTLVLVAALIMAWGCSSSDGDELAASTFESCAKPSWIVNLEGTDNAPSWTAPNPADYESSMIVMVKLQEELAMYSSEADLMTVFIGDECRTKPASPNSNAHGCYFILKIWGNTLDRDVIFSLRYYCASLHQVFVQEWKENFAAERTIGVDEDFVPSLLKGSTKYPLQSSLTVNLPDNAPFTPADGDCVAVFAGVECRGVGTVGEPFTVFRTTEKETLQVHYYSIEKAGVYTLKQPLSTENDITLHF